MLDYAAHYVGVADDDANFEVVHKRLVGKVRAAQEGNPLVSRDKLGVQRGA